MSLVRVWLHLLYSAKKYQEDKDSLVLTATEWWRIVLCTCLCLWDARHFVSTSPRWSLSLSSWSAGYAETEGKFAQTLGYIRNHLERFFDYFLWYMSLTTLQISALAVPDVEFWSLHHCIPAQLHAIIFSDWCSKRNTTPEVATSSVLKIIVTSDSEEKFL